ncbi:hypothetical protein ACFXOK_10565 [Streptomyces sp. NPDC059173]|uniref:hypothetical protein n=1 Tax=Streptomyces sp. NPDC059173 TaxID=3346756 RepID=UPI003692887B
MIYATMASTIGLTATLTGIATWGQKFSDWPAWASYPLLPLVVAVVWLGSSAVWLTSQQARATVTESRQRLTRAEFAFADALRGTPVRLSDRALLYPQNTTGGEATPDDATHRRSLLELAALWEATHARLDLYHQIATGQAKTSFRNAQVAMGAGFFLLILFACIALWASTTAVAIVAGGLGAVAAALAGYVAKTFVRSQESAATHLRSYFDQPLELSRYLAAERLVADGDLTQEQRGEILSALVQAMVAGPQPPAPPQAVAVVPVPGQQRA